MDDDSSSNPGSPGEAGFMAAVLVVMFICLFVGWKTPETVVFMCLVLAWNVGLVNTTEALSGFSNAGMLAVGALFVVIKGVEKSQLADKAARRVFGLRTSLPAGLGRMMSLCFVLSAFLNNTPVVALLIPITRDWARARGFSPSIFLIPLSYSCIMGGLLTVIGTSTNLVVQGLVLDERLVDPSIEAIGFFEPAYIGIPLGVVGMLYLVIFAPRILPSRGGLFRYVRDRAKELLTEVQVMSDFPYKGEPAGLVLARLGLPQDTLIKIRRKISPGILRQMSQSMEGNANLSRPVSTLFSSWTKEGATAQLQQQQQQQQGVSAIMEANQKTFRAESMYSYRMRAESLWGTKDDLCQEEKTMSPVACAAAAAAASAAESSNSGPASGRFSRKRWVSDTDASSLWGLKPQRSGLADASNGNGGSSAAVAAAATPGTNKNGGPQSEVEDGETYTDIFPVSAAEPIQDGDVLFLSCAQATMIDFQAVTVSQRLKGLKFLDVSALDLPGHGTEFFEIVLSGHNHFVGRSASRDNAEFAAYYNVSVVAVRRRGQSEAVNPASVVSAPPSSSVVPSSAHVTGSFKSRHGPAMDHPEVFIEEGVEPALNPNSRAVSPSGSVQMTSPPPPPAAAALPPPPKSEFLSMSRGRGLGGRGLSGVLPRSPMIRGSRKNTVATEDEHDVTESSFKAGDVVLVLAKEEFMEKYGASKDFFLLTKVGSVPKPVRYFDYLPLLAFLGMLIWVLLDADMVQAAFTAGAILIFGGWVDAKKTVSYVDWSLLLLIGSALGLSKGIVNSGLADYVGGAIRDSGISADASLFVLYAFTMTCTELITNNAAAALATPIAFSISRELGVSYKPFILTVMLAASSSFITPIGYQTNTLVWGPGGYKFTDFMKIGTPLSLIYLVLGCLIVPRVFPF